MPPAPPAKKKGKVLIWILIAVAALVVLGAAVLIGVYVFTHGTTDDGFSYTLSLGSHATITGYKGNGGDIEIPERIRDLSVEYIDGYAFENGDEIITLTVSTGVYPFSYAFSGCDSLTGVIMEGTDDIWPAWESALLGRESLTYVLFTETKAYEYCMDRGRLNDLDDVVICCIGQDTGWGRIRSVESSGGIVYAFTDQQTAVILLLPSGVDGDLLSPSLNGYTVILPDGRVPGQPRVITGETEEGFTYEMPEDRSYCIITGYTGSERYLSIPNTIDGAKVTVIGERAFAGNTTIESIFFNDYQEEIRAGAFEGCTNLRDIYVYSYISADSSAFRNCSRLRCAVLANNSLSLYGWSLPSDFCILYDGMGLDIGYLDYVGVSDQGVIYGVTTDEKIVVVDIPAGKNEIEILDTVYGLATEWIYSGALDDVSSSTVVWLPENTIFPYELWEAVDWNFLNAESAYTLSECWWYSCYLCDLVNKEMGWNGVIPDIRITRAAMQGAEDLSWNYDASYRPDGRGWFSVLGDCGVDYAYASGWKSWYDDQRFDDNFVDDMYEVAADFATSESDYYYSNYERVGMGLYYDTSTDTVYKLCLAVIDD